ncbi:jg9634 [Pararge aegeria aegeria]|uniref:Jg9634 protein n=1 Tax=Pararge aegeria aegeria TaxID=348720 RepID=A0A8S4RT87_9NEOP|nr:jg9634 [Pararge aegeria aegeria]
MCYPTLKEFSKTDQPFQRSSSSSNTHSSALYISISISSNLSFGQCIEYCSHLWDGSAKYQLDALDSVDRRARRLIGNDLVVSRLQAEHRRKVACLAVLYKIHFGECAQELFDLVKPSPFYHRTARYRKNLHRYVVEIPSTRTKRFASSFLIRTAKAWNALPSPGFPHTYNLGTFKSRVNRHLLGKRASF